MVDRIQGIKRRLRQIRYGAGNTPEQDYAVLVGNRSNGVDELDRRLLSEIAGEERAKFIASHMPESAGSHHSHRTVEVVEQLTQLRNRLAQETGEPARIRANLRVVVAQQFQYRFRPAVWRRGGRLRQRPVADTAPERSAGRSAERALAPHRGRRSRLARQCCRLFAHDAIGTETGKAAA
jgi:hypothetical protein